MIVDFHAEAAAELAAHLSWYEERRPGLGGVLLGEVREVVAAIAEFPARYPLSAMPRARRGGVRRAPLRRFPLVVEYLKVDDLIFVVAVSHMSRKPGYWLRRIRQPV